MARPRAFDERTARERVRRQFWTYGYEGTSVCDLTRVTGLSRSSLYEAFGDKRAMFLSALEHYLADGRRRLRGELEGAATGGEAIRRLLIDLVRMAQAGRPRRGCFAVNSMVESAPHDSDVRRLLHTHEAEMRRDLGDALKRGQADGSVRTNLDVEAATKLLRTFIHGLQVAGKASLEAATDESMVDLVLWSINPPPRGEGDKK